MGIEKLSMPLWLMASTMVVIAEIEKANNRIFPIVRLLNKNKNTVSIKKAETKKAELPEIVLV